MRLSADRDDVGFKALQASQRSGAYAVVMVDGSEVKHCVTADTKRGIAVVYETDSTSRYQLTSKGNAVKRKLLAGRVSISFRRD